MQRSLACALALLVIVPVLSGCVVPTELPFGDAGTGPSATSRGADLWSEASSVHPSSLDAEGRTLELSGDLRLVEPGRDIRLVAPLPPVQPAGLPGAPVVIGPQAPERLIFEDATLETGERGTLVADFGSGITLTALAGDADATPRALRAERGEVRERLNGFPAPPFRAQFRYCSAGAGEGAGCSNPEDAPAPVPEAYRRGLLMQVPLDLPEGGFTVEGGNLTFIDRDQNRTALGARATLRSALALLSPEASPGTKAVDRALPSSLDLTWEGNLTLSAEGAAGRITVDGVDRSIPAGRLQVSLRGAGAFRLDPSGAGFRASGVEGDAVDVRTDGAPRLGAAVVALPEIIEAEGEPGKVARFKVVLAEASGGAHAHLDGFRVEEAPGLEVKFAGAEDFVVTRALLDLIHGVANRTAESPWAAPVTVPAMVAIGVAVPWFAIAEGFLAIVNALFEPLLDGVVPAGEAQLATFEARVPDAPVEALLVIQGKNFDESAVKVQIRPAAPGDAEL